MAIKAAKYADQPNLVPFIVETGGYINRRAHLFLDPPPTPGPRGTSGDRHPKDVALRGVMQALVRIQAYLLADIVVAVPAVDLAVEAVVWCVLPKHPWFSVHMCALFQSESCDTTLSYARTRVRTSTYVRTYVRVSLY